MFSYCFDIYSDHILCLSVSDGLNRLPMEFTIAKSKACQYHESNGEDNPVRLEGHPSKGLVIMSEFISSARVMRGALIVNPWRVIEVND